MNTSTLTRKSVPLDAETDTLAHEVREPGTPARRAVESVVGPLPDTLSEAQALANLLAVARASVRDQVNATGYAAYAASVDDEDRAFAAAARARRNERERRRAEAGTE